MNSPFGIDLGTTNSAICTLNEYGKPELIPNAEGQKITPSVVQLRADGSALVGDLRSALEQVAQVVGDRTTGPGGIWPR